MISASVLAGKRHVLIAPICAVTLAILVGSAVATLSYVIEPRWFLRFGAACGALGLCAFAGSNLLRLADSRRPLRFAGTLLIGLGAVTVTFNGVRALPFADVSDIFVAAAVVLLLIDAAINRSFPTSYPTPVWVGPALIGLSAAIAVARSGPDIDQTLPAGEVVIAFLGVPLVAVLAADTPARAHALVRLWLVSATINAAIAIADAYLGTGIGEHFVGLAYAGRPTGLTIHPNHLGIAVAMAVPPALAICIRPSFGKLDRAIAITMLPLLCLAVLISGSRAALVAVGAGFVVMIAISPIRLIARLSAIGAIAATAVGISTVLARGATGFSAIDRLAGGTSVAASDVAHQVAFYDALSNFQKNWLLGVGFANARTAHDVYVQLLQAGGILALVGLGVFAAGALWAGVNAVRLRPEESGTNILIRGLCASFATWLVAGLVQNLLYDRFLLVPAAIAVAIWCARSLGPRQLVRDIAETVPIRKLV